jgi:hypothetical protein
MPFPNFHACRQRNPNDFNPKTFRNTMSKMKEKPVQLIIGKIKGKDSESDPTVLQSIRMPVEHWTKIEAKALCESTKTSFEFEAAKE